MKRSSKPSGSTPGKPAGKANRREGGGQSNNLSSRRSLFNFKPDKDGHTLQPAVWSTEERRALVEYVALFSPVSEENECSLFKWPSGKDPIFWEKCADALACTTGMPRRSGNACRHQVNSYLRKQYATLEEAEEDLQVNYFCGGLHDTSLASKANDPGSVNSTPQSMHKNNTPSSPVFAHSPHANSANPETCHGDTIAKVVRLLMVMSSRMRRDLLQNLFWQYMCLELGSDLQEFVPSDFIELCCKGMNTLKLNGKGNIIYYLAKGLGTPRQDGSGPRLPIDRMPFGLLSYNIRYFAMDTVNNIYVDSHYLQWETTMFSNFGHKWICLQRGPGFAYLDDAGENSLDSPCPISTATCEQRSVGILQQAWNETFEGGINALKDKVDGGDCPVEMGNQYELESPAEVRDVVHSVNPAEVSDQVELNNLGFEPVDRTCSQRQGVSYLWARLGSAELEEVVNGDAPTELERLHGICPQPQKRKGKEVDPMKAKVNVAGHSVRTLQRHIQAANFSRDTKVQVIVLKKIKDSNKNGRWWIKADACDLRKGLRESMRHEWAGDCDLGDGKQQMLYQEYIDRRTFYAGLGLKARKVTLKEDMALVISGLDVDLRFLVDGEKAAKEKYAARQRQVNASEDSMFGLAWECESFQTLININKELKSFSSSILLRISANQRVGNIAADVSSLRQRLLCYTQDFFSKRREAASHLMIFMIADEKRNMKPYAVPVQFIPYHSMTDRKLRELCQELCSVMENLGMVVVGTVTDGEFNSIRTMGEKRAVSIIQVIMDAKAEARKTNVNTIRRYLTPVKVQGANGTFSVRAQSQHPAIPAEDILWLYNITTCVNAVPFERAIHMLKRKLFPADYGPYPWDTKKREEDTKDCLNSLMANYLFRHKVRQMKEELNVDFSKHLYQPELCEATGEFVHQREDHNHVLKRITECLRSGEIPGVNVCYFADALHDADSGLTYEALTGKQKQSVPHCEQIFSKGVLEFMQRNGHASEAHFVEVVRNWHKAADGRGLTEDMRSKYNNDMMNFLLDDWMPWHKTQRDFSMLDVMRPIKGIQGFTREIVVALIANCESLEIRRAEYLERGLPPEHPRASSTDDVEGFIAHLHDQLGEVFDHKEFLDQQPKILNEFNKKIDPDLQFHYWTGHRHRYSTIPLPSFNEPSGITERLDRIRISRRSDPGVFVANRASLPQRNSLTVRASFHRAPEQLPPPRTVGGGS